MKDPSIYKELTDLHKAVMYSILSDLSINDERFYDIIKELSLYNYISFDESNNKYTVTKLGNQVLKESIIKIVYPLSKGNIGSFDHVIRTLSHSAKNALICSQISNKGFCEINYVTAQTLLQNLVDNRIFANVNPTLSVKIINMLKEKDA